MARWIKWYGPDRGRGSVEDVVSHQPQVKAELASQAMLIYARAASNLETKPRLRTGESSVGIHGPAQGRYLDYIVYLSAGGEGDEGTADAASGIERTHGILAEAVGRAIRRGAGS